MTKQPSVLSNIDIPVSNQPLNSKETAIRTSSPIAPDDSSHTPPDDSSHNPPNDSSHPPPPPTQISGEKSETSIQVKDVESTITEGVTIMDVEDEEFGNFVSVSNTKQEAESSIDPSQVNISPTQLNSTEHADLMNDATTNEQNPVINDGGNDGGNDDQKMMEMMVKMMVKMMVEMTVERMTN